MAKANSFWAPVKKQKLSPAPLFSLNLKPQKVKPIMTPVLIGNSRKYISIHPVNLKLYPTRTKKEIKLIDKNPWGDCDKDKVLNFFDCKPLNRKKQDFGKFKYRKGSNREVESFTAAERFGGANIKKLKKIGSGRDRIVYQLDKDKVLKIAKNPAGLRQNILESDLGGYLEQIKYYETGKDYVVMEKAGPLSLKSADKLSELRAKANKLKLETTQKKAIFGSPETVENIHKGAERKVIEELNPDFLNYDISYGDIIKPSSWGEKEGKLVLIDAGALSEERITGEHKIGRIKERLKRAYQQKEEAKQSKNTNFYKERLPQINKNIAEMELEVNEWNNIQRERRRFKDKGTKIKIEKDLTLIQVKDEDIKLTERAQSKKDWIKEYADKRARMFTGDKRVIIFPKYIEEKKKEEELIKKIQKGGEWRKEVVRDLEKKGVIVRTKEGRVIRKVIPMADYEPIRLSSKEPKLAKIMAFKKTDMGNILEIRSEMEHPTALEEFKTSSFKTYSTKLPITILPKEKEKLKFKAQDTLKRMAMESGAINGDTSYLQFPLTDEKVKIAKIKNILEREPLAVTQKQKKEIEEEKRVMLNMPSEKEERKARAEEIDRIAEDIREQKRIERESKLKDKDLNAVQDIKDQEPSQDVIEESIEDTSPKEDLTEKMEKQSSLVSNALESMESMPEVAESMKESAEESTNE